MIDGELAPGNNIALWDTTDPSNARLVAGIAVATTRSLGLDNARVAIQLSEEQRGAFRLPGLAPGAPSRRYQLVVRVLRYRGTHAICSGACEVGSVVFEGGLLAAAQSGLGPIAPVSNVGDPSAIYVTGRFRALTS